MDKANMDKGGHVYILASARNGVLYVGVTSNLAGRISDHRDGRTPGFTTEYGVTALVWYEVHAEITSAIRREKSLKRWRREWKLDLIEKTNPDWLDLWPTLFGGEAGPALARLAEKEKLDPGSSPG